MRRAPPLRAFLAFLVVCFVSLAWSGRAEAYPWMIRHEYTACAQCHFDPSGGGLLTQYGRGIGELVMPSHYGPQPVDPGEPGRGAKFLWGAVPLPEWLELGGSLRVMEMLQKIEDVPLVDRFIYMQADAMATVHAGRFVASGSLGYADEGALAAAITPDPEHNLVSRVHWVGFRLDEAETLLVRAGRMNLPFGIRDIQHTLFARSATRTDINDDQQHGVALSYSGGSLRSEVMAILGNYQIGPDAYRERGVSGYAEWAPATNAALGASGRFAHVQLDPRTFTQAYRHAYGVFGRYGSPTAPLVLMTELDYVIDSYKLRPRDQGLVGYAQADLEPIAGVHYQLTGEISDVGPDDSEFSYGIWGSVLWFIASHVSVRVDGIHHSIPTPAGRTDVNTLLLQGHLYL